jgi:hypothetical protein
MVFFDSLGETPLCSKRIGDKIAEVTNGEIIKVIEELNEILGL